VRIEYLTEHQRTTLTNALYVAFHEFERLSLANEVTRNGDMRLRDQFKRQCDEMKELTELLEQADDIKLAVSSSDD
jgi:hypothetical protein